MWTRKPPTKPGIYWFCTFHNTPYKLRIIETLYNPHGKPFLGVSNMDAGDWGPDQRSMALNMPGWWQEVQPPANIYEGE